MKTSMLNFNSVNFPKNQSSNPRFGSRNSSPHTLSFQGQPGDDCIELTLRPATSQKPSLKARGENNLHKAIRQGISDTAFDELVKEVEKHSDTDTLNGKGGPKNETPLHAAVRAGSKYKVARLLGAPGIILNEHDEDGYTPLGLADTYKASGKTRMEIYRMLYVICEYPRKK